MPSIPSVVLAASKRRRRPPGAPSISQITSNTAVGALAVAFTAPADPTGGGSPVTNYEYSTNNGLTWVARSPASTSTPITISGLTLGQTFTVRLRAINEAGVGTQSASAQGTVFGPPGAPSITQITSGTVGALTVAFTAPAAPPGGGWPITNYEYSTNNGSTWTAVSPASTSTPITISGLTLGQTFTVRLRAVNAAGVGPQSASVQGTALGYNAASGGSVSTVSNYLGTGETWNVHTFTSGGTFSVTRSTFPFKVLVAGAGSPGGAGVVSPDGGFAGSGGAGGRYVYNQNASLPVTSYAVTVGTNGSASSIGSAFSSASGAFGGAANSPGVQLNITGSSIGYVGGGGNGGFNVANGDPSDVAFGVVGQDGGGTGGSSQPDFIASYGGGGPGVRGGGGGGGAGATSVHQPQTVGGGSTTGIVIIAYRTA